jgi:hypothetical protein
MLAGAARERVTITISTAPSGYNVRGTYYASGGQTKETWSLSKTYEEIEAWSYAANQRLGYKLPPLPPRDLCTVLQLEEFCNKALQLEPLWRSQEDLRFFAVPRSLLEEDEKAAAAEEEEDATPTYKPDVYDVVRPCFGSVSVRVRVYVCMCVCVSDISFVFSSLVVPTPSCT